MPGVLELFNAAVESGENIIFSGELDVINDAARRNYVMTTFLHGTAQDMIIEGGLSIKDRIFLESVGNFRPYRPLQSQTVVNAQPGDNWRTGFSYHVDELSYTEQEIESNIAPQLTTRATRDRIKDLMYQKQMAVWTSMMNGMDDLGFAVPSATQMEIQAGSEDLETLPSIPMFINEFPNGLYDSVQSGTFTTIQGLNPVNKPEWDCQRTTYDAADTNSTKNGIINAFERMTTRIQYRKPGMAQRFFTGREQMDQNTQMPEMFIATDFDGYDKYRESLRALYTGRHDLGMVNRADPSFVDLAHGGAKMWPLDVLNDAPLYPDDTTPTPNLVKQADASPAGPRYYVIDPAYMKLAFKRGKMFTPGELRRPDRTYDTYYQPWFIWPALVCRSRRRHGMVHPVTV